MFGRVALLLLPVSSAFDGWGARGDVTIYGPIGAITSGAASATDGASTSAAATYIPAAFNTETLTAPAVPTPAPPTQFTVPLQNDAADVTGLSIEQSGSFYGFSIEISVANQIGEYYVYFQCVHGN